MLDNTTTASTTPLGQMLADFVERVPGVVASLLVTADGLVSEYAGPEEWDADTLAAGVSGIASLAAGMFPGASGRMLQTVVEHEDGALFVMRADGPTQMPGMVGALLAVRSTPEADPQVVGYEMGQWIDGMRAHLRDRVRSAPQPVL
ncbi:roadblock/LC7 domain-containing protein [Streptomyces cacaoi]